jgi:hypothetical protein
MLARSAIPGDRVLISFDESESITRFSQIALESGSLGHSNPSDAAKTPPDEIFCAAIRKRIASWLSLGNVFRGDSSESLFAI